MTGSDEVAVATPRRQGVKPACSTPCGACPWRTSNHGVRHPDGWYTKTNLRRLWTGLRTGEAPGMTCHPTDPEMPVPDSWRRVPVDTVTRECAGAQTLIQRELWVFERMIQVLGMDAPIFKLYRLLRPRGLTRGGLAYWINSQMLAGTQFGSPNRMTKQDLNAPVSIGAEGALWPIDDQDLIDAL